MKENGRTELAKYTLSLFILGFLLTLVPAVPTTLFGKEQLDVTRDKDKTVYSIDSSERTRQDYREDRDRAWDMLNHMPIILDNRQNQNLPTQPAPTKPAPAPAR